MSHFLTSHSLDTPGASQGLNGGEPVAAPLPGLGVHPRSRLLDFNGVTVLSGHTVRYGLLVGLVVRTFPRTGVAAVRWSTGDVVGVMCSHVRVVAQLGRLHVAKV